MLTTVQQSMITRKLSLAELQGLFLQQLEGLNASPATLKAYQIDLSQFLTFLNQEYGLTGHGHEVGRAELIEYLTWLGSRGNRGVTRARKLATIKAFFRFLVDCGAIDRSPAESLPSPKRERTAQPYLRPDEYPRLLSEAGGNARDFAVLQLLLQTGMRVCELCALSLDDVDLIERVVTLHGKGHKDRRIELEPKAVKALKSYLAVRPHAATEALFLNRYGEPIGERGVRKRVTHYIHAAGISKKASCHALRRTFATEKHRRGVPLRQLQEWLGHERLDTTQRYIYLAKQDSRKVMEATSL